MYFLPLVIEQVAIGVSSALDIGPTISHIVETAESRDSHNPITELLTHVQRLVKSGLSLEESLVEVGEASGFSEVQHTFMFLSQCAKHGGELTSQLQELADSVSMQRQVMVEERITKLPVKATFPLAMVLAGFMGILLAGLISEMMLGFSTLN